MKLIEKLYSDAFEEGFNYAMQKLFGLHGRRVKGTLSLAADEIVERRKNFKEAVNNASKDSRKIEEKADRIRREMEHEIKYGDLSKYKNGFLRTRSVDRAEGNMKDRAYQPVRDLYDKMYEKISNLKYNTNNTPERTLNTYINDKVSKKGYEGISEVVDNRTPDVENYVKKKGVVADMFKKLQK